MNIDWLLDRLSENSTWRGIIGLLTALGVTLSPDQAGKIVAAGFAIVGLINVLRKSPPSEAKVKEMVAAQPAIKPLTPPTTSP